MTSSKMPSLQMVPSKVLRRVSTLRRSQRKSVLKISSVILFGLMLNGCAFNSFMFEARENKPVIIIEHPPNRVAFGGNLNDKDMYNLKKVLVIMQRMPYQDHHYNSPLGVNVEANINNVRTSNFSATIQEQPTDQGE